MGPRQRTVTLRILVKSPNTKEKGVTAYCLTFRDSTPMSEDDEQRKFRELYVCTFTNLWKYLCEYERCPN
jgi:hypothetical protein